MSLNTTAVRIKVTVKDVKPEVMRRLVVPVTLRLDRLHLTLQKDEQSPLRVLRW